MSVEQNKAIARRLYEEIVNKGNLAAIDELITTDFIDHNAFPEQAAGLEGTKQVFTMIRTAFPDLHFTVEDMIAEGDKVVSRVTFRGTHQGEFMGIAPTNRPVMVALIDIFRIAGDKIVERSIVLQCGHLFFILKFVFIKEEVGEENANLYCFDQNDRARN